MHAFSAFASLLLLLLTPSVRAGIYVTQPLQATICTGGQSCLVQWRDDGQAPSLAVIGECQVGLYTDEFVPVLTQSLPSVDVSATSSFSFTPDPAAGANGLYHIIFTSDRISYRVFSAIFTLSGLTGTNPRSSSNSATFLSPVPTAPGASTPVAGTTMPTGSTTSPGTSTPVAGTTTPTSSTPPPGTIPATGTPTQIRPTATTTGRSTSTTPATTTSARTSTSASATPTSAASRIASSMSLGGLAAMFALSCVLVF